MCVCMKDVCVYWEYTYISMYVFELHNIMIGNSTSQTLSQDDGEVT